MASSASDSASGGMSSTAVFWCVVSAVDGVSVEGSEIVGGVSPEFVFFASGSALFSTSTLCSALVDTIGGTKVVFSTVVFSTL